MRSTGSKSSTPSGDDKPADSSEITPAIAVDAQTGAMRDIESPAPSAAPRVSPTEPLAGLSPLTHHTGAYGCRISVSLDHTHAVLTPPEGPAIEYASRLNEEPTAFQKAIQEAKGRWRAAVLEDEESRQRTRRERIDAAIAANQRSAK